MKPLTIGDVARRAGVGVETVRFYERQGLLEEPQRRASGYRQYDEEAVAVLRFIRRAKGLGFTLKEIKGLLELRLDASASRAEVRRQARAKSPTSRPGSPTSSVCGTCCRASSGSVTATGPRPAARSWGRSKAGTDSRR